jgi:hypothetical protein
MTAALKPLTKCEHKDFKAMVNVGRLLDNATESCVVGYIADIRIKCAECGLPFEFLGLEPGVDTQGARVSLDGLEARIALTPKGTRPNPFQRRAFNVRNFDG